MSNRFSAKVLLTFAILGACCPAFAGTWTITFSGGSGTNGDGSAGTATTTVVSANSATWSMTTTEVPTHTASVSGPTSFHAVWSGGANDPAVRAAVVCVLPDSEWEAHTGIADDGNGDGEVDSWLGGGVWDGSSAGYFYTTPVTSGAADFSKTITAATTTGVTGWGDSANPGGATVSVNVTVYAVGFSYGGTTSFSGAPHILIGQQLTTTLVSQVPAGGSADTYTWLHPIVGDAAAPFTNYTPSTSSASLTAFTTPPTSFDQVKCYFSKVQSDFKPECTYYSRLLNRNIDVLAPVLPIDAPTLILAQNSKPKINIFRFADVTYSSYPTISNVTLDSISPNAFILWGSSNGLSTPGCDWDISVVDPSGYSGTGQWGNGQLLQDQVPSPLPSWALDGIFPYNNVTFPATTTAGNWNDSPAVGALNTMSSPFTYTYHKLFKNYVFYRPPGSTTVYVPVAYLPWTGWGTCTLTGTTWSESNQNSALGTTVSWLTPANFPIW